MQYKAFISYSHMSDLAAALQHGLQQFAKVWYQLRAIRVFRDKTGIVPGQGLTSAIETALDESEYLVLLASPSAAASDWVQQEVDYWASHRDAQKIVLVLTEGQIVWSRKSRDLDWDRTDALPKSLTGVFKEEPVYLDLRWARNSQELSLTNPRFREAIVDLSSALRNIPKDVLDGEDVRQLKRARRFRRAAIAAVATLAVAAVTAGILWYHQRTQAFLNQQTAEKNALAADKNKTLADAQTKITQSLQLVRKASQADSYGKTIALNIQAIESAPTEPAVKALRVILAEKFDELLNADKRRLRTAMAVDPSGRTVALASPYRSALAMDLQGGPTLDLCEPASIDSLWFSPNGQYLLAIRGEVVQVWDMGTRRQISEISVGKDLSEDESGLKVWFTPKSTAFVTRSVSRNLGLWALPSGRKVADLPGTQEDDTVIFNPSMPTFLTYSATRPTGTSASMWTLTGKFLWRPDPLGFYWAAFYRKGSSLVASRVFYSDSGDRRLEVHSWTLGKDGVPQDPSDFDLTQLAGEPRETILGVLPLPAKECTVVVADTVICTTGLQPELYEAAGMRRIETLPGWPFTKGSARARASTDGTLVVFDNDKGLAVWDAASRSFLWVKLGVVGPAVFSDDNQRVAALNDGALSAFEARSGKAISLANGMNACAHEDLYAYETPILWTDRKGKKLIARTAHDLCVWDVDGGKLLHRLNLFGPDRQRLEQDRKSLNRYPPEQLVAVAKQLLQGCASPLPPAWHGSQNGR